MELKKEIKKEEEEIEEIRKVLILLKSKILDKRPSYFSKRDIVNAFFGSLIIALTFILKGAVVDTAKGLSIYHIEAIILFTFLILIVEIYFIGYSRVTDKEKRKLGQFMTKRMVTLYIISISVSFFLVYLLNLNSLMPDFYHTMKLVIIVSMPSAIGSAVPNLLKQY